MVENLPAGESQQRAGPDCQRRHGNNARTVNRRDEGSDHHSAEQQGAQDVDGGLRGFGPSGRMWQEPERKRHQDQYQGNIREEQDPPSDRGVAHGQDKSADQRATDRGGTACGSVGTQRFRAVMSRVDVLQEAKHLRIQGACAETLEEPRDDDQRWVRGQPTQQARRSEDCNTRDKERAPSHDVSEPARGNQRDAERQGVTGKDPLHRA